MGPIYPRRNQYVVLTFQPDCAGAGTTQTYRLNCGYWWSPLSLVGLNLSASNSIRKAWRNTRCWLSLSPQLWDCTSGACLVTLSARRCPPHSWKPACLRFLVSLAGSPLLLRIRNTPPMTRAITEKACAPELPRALGRCRGGLLRSYRLQRAAAAFFAMARRFAGDRAAALAEPPFVPPRRPRSTADASFPAIGSSSCTSPVVIPTMSLAN